MRKSFAVSKNTPIFASSKTNKHNFKNPLKQGLNKFLTKQKKINVS